MQNKNHRTSAPAFARSVEISLSSKPLSLPLSSYCLPTVSITRHLGEGEESEDNTCNKTGDGCADTTAVRYPLTKVSSKTAHVCFSANRSRWVSRGVSSGGNTFPLIHQSQLTRAIWRDQGEEKSIPLIAPQSSSPRITHRRSHHRHQTFR